MKQLLIALLATLMTTGVLACGGEVEDEPTTSASYETESGAEVTVTGDDEEEVEEGMEEVEEHLEERQEIEEEEADDDWS